METTPATLRRLLEDAGFDADQAAHDADGIFELILEAMDAACVLAGNVYQNHLYEYVREFGGTHRLEILRAMRTAMESVALTDDAIIDRNDSDADYLPFGICTGIA